MGNKILDLLLPLLLNLVHVAYCENVGILSCNTTTLNPCPVNQMCQDVTKRCVCKKGFNRIDDYNCSPSEPDAAGHTTIVIVVSVFTLALVVCGLVLLVRKYELVDYVRQRMPFRRNNDILYEDVMIGQDDPPLSP